MPLDDGTLETYTVELLYYLLCRLIGIDLGKTAAVALLLCYLKHPEGPLKCEAFRPERIDVNQPADGLLCSATPVSFSMTSSIYLPRAYALGQLLSFRHWSFSKVNTKWLIIPIHLGGG